MTSKENAEASIPDLPTVVASEFDEEEEAAALPLATLGVPEILNTLRTILASASTTLVRRLCRSDCTADGSVVAHAGVETSVTGGAVANEYWFVDGTEARDSMLLAREESSLAGISKATATAREVATGPWSREEV